MHKRRWLGLGWHWLWFVPLCALLLLVVERHMVVFGFTALRAAWERWTWGVLFSPSAVFCWGVIAFSITFPLFGMGMIGVLVAERQQPHRWLWAILVIVVILLLPVVTDILIWGSFPLTFDNSGVARLRMIPFIPWPSGDFGEF